MSYKTVELAVILSLYLPNAGLTDKHHHNDKTHPIVIAVLHTVDINSVSRKEIKPYKLMQYLDNMALLSSELLRDKAQVGKTLDTHTRPIHSHATLSILFLPWVPLSCSSPPGLQHATSLHSLAPVPRLFLFLSLTFSGVGHSREKAVCFSEILLIEDPVSGLVPSGSQMRSNKGCLLSLSIWNWVQGRKVAPKP